MIKGKKISINLILGILIGFFLSVLVVAEGYALLFAVKGDNLELVGPIKGMAIFKGLAFIVFVATIFIFTSKKIMKMNLNKIGIYLTLSVIASLVTAIEATMLMLITIGRMFPNIAEKSINNFFVSVNLAAGSILLGIVIFIIVFTAFVNRKVKYIRFLTEEVKVIKDEGFGKTIEVRGEDELAELCESINEMSLELREKIDNEKKIEQNKNELITNVSHDLRTPLTSIIGYVDLVKMNGFQDKDKFDEYIDIIDERAKSLNKLINELFEYTKLNSHDLKLNYSRVELGALVEQITGEHAVIFKREGLSLESEISNKDIFAELDIEKMVRVLENLLTNARKYSVRNSTVKVKLYEENKDIVISVENETDNIGENDLENLFERFYKADKARKESDSTGLGLSIVKRIVELHGGKVEVSLDNKIITFKVMLPLQ